MNNAMSPRPLHKDSSMEEWDARATESGITGEELRCRTLAADEFLLNLFFPTAVGDKAS